MNSDQKEIPFIQPRRLGRVNWLGLWTLIRREVWRFVEVYPQTIIAPVVTTILFYAIFSLAFGGGERVMSDGTSYMRFVLPGLVMMAMAQNAFANTSSSLLLSKIQGNIVDIIMAPLSPLELTFGYVAGGVLRGLAVGAASLLAVWVFSPMEVRDWLNVIGYAVLGSAMLSSLGLATGIWSEKFDHMATVQNFIILPATFLSGTFYSLDQLPPAWRSACLYNPFFYMNDGFRHGFTGSADGNSGFGIASLIICNVAAFALCWAMFRSGYRLKAR